MIVYKITNTVNGKSYIGITTKSINARWRSHLVQMRLGNERTLYKAMRKYGHDKFTVQQIDSAVSIDVLGELERRYIFHFNSFGSGGYNMCAGGAGPLGMSHTEEAKRKMSEASKRRPPDSPETREKKRLAMLGNRIPDASVAIRAEKLRGQKRSEYQKLNISQGRIGKGLRNDGARKHPKEVLTHAIQLLKNGATQAQVSSITGLHQSYLSRLKNNHRGATLQGA